MTPQGQVGAPEQQSWFSKNWMWVALGGCGVPMVCCLGGLVVALIFGDPVTPEGLNPNTNPIRVVETPAARVDCGTPGPGGVDCEVTRTAGTAGLEACWTLDITCENRGVMSANGCGELVEGQGSVTVNIPVSDFSNQEGCDAPKSGAVKALEVTTR